MGSTGEFRRVMFVFGLCLVAPVIAWCMGASIGVVENVGDAPWWVVIRLMFDPIGRAERIEWALGVGSLIAFAGPLWVAVIAAAILARYRRRLPDPVRSIAEQHGVWPISVALLILTPLGFCAGLIVSAFSHRGVPVQL